MSADRFAAHMPPHVQPEFVRWLAQTIKEAKADAWVEGRAAQAMHEVRVRVAEFESADPPTPPPNPYQKEKD